MGYNPYDGLSVSGDVLALVKDGNSLPEVAVGDDVEIILPETCFYIAAGGQVADTGRIYSNVWEVEITDVRRPAAGLISHIGKVVKGTPKTGDSATAVRARASCRPRPRT